MKNLEIGGHAGPKTRGRRRGGFEGKVARGVKSPVNTHRDGRRLHDDDAMRMCAPPPGGGTAPTACWAEDSRSKAAGVVPLDTYTDQHIHTYTQIYFKKHNQITN